MGTRGSEARASRLVRFVSPFGSPAWMTRERAERLLAEDDARWLRHQAQGTLSCVLPAKRIAEGPPQIEGPA